MKHSITLTLQQIEDLDAIRVHLATRASKAYAKAENKTLHPWRNDHIAEGDRLLRQSHLINGIIKQIKANG